MQNNEPVDNSDSFKQKSVTVNDPSGTVFFELSTAASKNYENNKPGSKGHIANSFAVNGVQSFSLVNVTGDSLSIDTYRTDTLEMYDSYTINKADRTKLDKSNEEANAIISSGKYSDDQLVELNAALQAAQIVPQDCDLVTAYDAAVALDEVIKLFDPILFGDANDNFHYAKEAIEYIGMHYTDNISLGEVSAYVGLSPSYFSRYFKSITKNTFVQYLNEVRLENALRDITENNVSVTNAALNNGFANVKSFIRMCKSVYNCTPTGYKIKYKSDIK